MSEAILVQQPHPMREASGRFQFSSDGTPAGDAAVRAMQAVCDGDYDQVKAIFGLGDVPGLPFTVTIDPGAGGAYHMTCADTGIHLIPEDAPTLLVAEHVECFQALSGRWDCGATPGEGLSRALAQVVRPGTVLGELDGDVQGWWSGGNPQDFVTQNSPGGDQDNVGNACATLFLFYLRSQLGYSWSQIAGSNGSNVLGDVYAELTGRAGAQGWQDFVSKLRAIDESGTLPVPGSGNPFPIGQPSPPEPLPPPTSGPPPSGFGGWLDQLEDVPEEIWGWLRAHL